MDTFLESLEFILSPVRTEIGLLSAEIKKLSKASIANTTSTTVNSKTLIAPTNPLRTALYLFNNGGNKITVYLADSATGFMEVGPNDFAALPSLPIFTGPIYASRPSGSNPVIVTELMP